MPLQSIPTQRPNPIFPSKTVQPPPLVPIAKADPKQILPLLKTQEQNIKSQVPSMFSDVISKIPSPSKAYSDYAITGNPIFKQAAGNALTALQKFSSKAKTMLSTPAEPPSILMSSKVEQMSPSNPLYYNRTQAEGYAVPVTVPNKYKDSIYDTATRMKVSPTVMGSILNKETGGNAHAVHKNKDGSVDMGLMQINSTNFQAVQKYFNTTGRHFDPFNPNDSVEAAAYLLKNNQDELKDKLGRNPTDSEVYSSYNLGVAGFMKAIQGNVEEKDLLKKYDKGSIFAKS